MNYTDSQIKERLLQQHSIEQTKNLGIPSELIELPSKGWYYPENHPLSSGKLDMRYPTAKDEDVLTSKNLRKQKVALERFLQGLIMTPGVKIDDILTIDIFAIMIAARVLGFTKDYNVEVKDPDDSTHKQKLNIDLTQLEELEHEFLEENKHINEFSFILPAQKLEVKWKYLTYKEENEVTKNVTNIKTGVDETITSLLKKQIVEINGERNPERIINFVDNMLSIDSRALRLHIEKTKPGINSKINYTSSLTGEQHLIELPLTTEFFFPTT
jgi:hypothetical protein